MTSISGIVHFCFIKKKKNKGRGRQRVGPEFIIPIKFTNFARHCPCASGCVFCDCVMASIKISHLSYFWGDSHQLKIIYIGHMLDT